MKKTTHIIDQLIVLRLTLQSYFVLLQGLCFISNRLIIVCQAWMNLWFLLFWVDSSANVFEMSDGLFIFLLVSQQFTNSLVAFDADQLICNFRSIFPEIFLVNINSYLKISFLFIQIIELQNKLENMLNLIRLLKLFQFLFELLYYTIFNHP